MNVNKTREVIREKNIKILTKESLGYYGKQHKPWCSKLLNQRKQAKLQLLQDMGKINGDNLEQRKTYVLIEM
jgi:hypothetical protein